MSEPSSKKKHLVKVLYAKQAFFCNEDQTVLDAALSTGLALPHSCRGGNCGRCVAQCRSGKFVYRNVMVPAGLSREQQERGEVLLCQVLPRSPMTVDIDAVRATAQTPVVKLPCRIVGREQVAKDVVKLRVQMPRSQPLQFVPGQHVDFILTDGRRRSYSLACLPSATNPLELHVRRVVGGVFSDIAFGISEHSDLLRLEGPLGRFGWRDPDRNAVLIAGGTGYAPLKAMLLENWQQNRDRQLHLFWGGRDVQDLYELSAMCERASADRNFSFTPVIETADADCPEIAVGKVHEIAMKQLKKHTDTNVYAAGPPAMMEALQHSFATAGMNTSQLFCDSFTYAQ
ncbi:MAG: 2Fe-2S iron-sulfur cluster binding domain-containing protein [Gammaproteobacteria bacterium]|nr:2Fe-2S iron-sulfur cluster binding domain-containing protein [Gammaproteobacteria bacterium]